MSGIPITSEELFPIYPTQRDANNIAQPVTPDDVTVVAPGTDLASIADGDFYTPLALNGGLAVWIRDLPAGPYRVVCRIDDAGDGQRPVWELDGEIIINKRV